MAHKIGNTVDVTEKMGRFGLQTVVGPWRVSTVDLEAGYKQVPSFRVLDELLDPLMGREAARYETMVFKDRVGGLDYDCIRTNTEADARNMHMLMCEKWSEIRKAKPLGHGKEET